nr:Ig-like domain-containing protein [Neiella litorisoli]
MSFDNGLIVEDEAPTLTITDADLTYVNQDGAGGDDDATLVVAGSVTDIAVGSTVTLLITDATGATLSADGIVAADGTFSLAVSGIADLAEGELTATVTGQGADGTPASDSAAATYDLLPVVTIEPVSGDDSTPTLSGTSANTSGDLTLDINGQIFSVTPNADGSWQFTVPDDAELADGTYTATISGVDGQGNTATDTTGFELIPTIDAPVVTITEDINDDGQIDSSELSGTVGVRVELPGNALAGDVLNVTDQDPIVLTQAQIDAGIVEFEFPVPANGETISVSASVTVTERSANDSAEGSDSAQLALDDGEPPVDTTPPSAPTVTITEDTNNDGTISNAELNGTVGVTVALPGDAVAGDTLNVTGQTPIVLSQTQIDAGSIDFEYAAPADGETIEVGATITDQAGNESAEGSDSAQMALDDGEPPVDTTPPSAPTVTITEDTNNDGTISNAELNGTVGVTVALSGDAVAGDTLNVTGQDAIVLSQAQIDAGSIDFEYAAPADGETIEVVATVTDQAGNESAEGSDSAVIGDTTATGAPTVTITEDTNNDGTISNTELNGTVGVTVALPGDAVAGDTLNVTGQDPIVLSQTQIDAGSIDFEYAAPADGETIEVVATVTDQAGNESAEGSDSAVIGDTTATGAPTVTITEDTNNDGTISSSELNGTVGVTVALPGDAVAGDTLNVTGQAPIVLSQTQIDAGSIDFEYAAPADGETIEVVATVTDQAGNESVEGSDSAVIGDTTATGAPTVTITEDTNNDGTISNAELNGTVGVTVALPSDAVAGDTLNVTGQDPIVLSQTQIDAGSIDFEYAAPADGETIEVVATITDQAGNKSAEGSDSAVIGDTTATGAPTVTITEDANNDGTISNTELNGSVDVTVALPGDAVAGDTLNVTGQDPIVLSQTQIDTGSIDFEYAAPADGETIEVVATITDQAGNESAEGSDSAQMALDDGEPPVDTTPPSAPTVTITEDTNNDGTISSSELNGTVGVTVALPGDAVAGDTLNVTGQDAIVLSQAQIDAGSIDFEYAAPADGETIEVVATVTDQAGNESAEGSDAAQMALDDGEPPADTTPPSAPTVTITEDTNNDGTISNTELNGTVGVTVSLPSDAVAGDTLNVTGQNAIVLSQTQIDAGSIDFEYAAPADGETIEVVATVTDQAGNESAEGSDAAVIGDTTATRAPTVTITEDTNNDGTISNTELNGTVGVTVALPGDAVAGDTLNVTGQDPIVLSQTQIDAGSIDFEYAAPADGETIEVVATVTDQAGNESAEGSDSAVIGDTTATGAPTVTITEDTNNDGTISNSELNGTVGVTVTLPSDAVAGDTLNVTGQTPIVLSQTQIDAGSIDFEYAAPADGETIEVVATVTDQAGNESAEGSDSAVIGDTTATGAPTVTITEDTNNDGTISNAELNGTVGVTVTLPAEAVAGDTLNVTGQTPIVLSQTQIDAGSIDFEYAAPADGETIEVVATITDQAGNESAEGIDSAVIGDTTATGAPTVTITEDTNNDGTISNAELNGTVGVTVALPSGAVAGDTLNVTGQDAIILSQAQIDAGSIDFEYAAPADGESIEVVATITDQVGNESAEGSDSAVIGDTTATGAPTVTITEDTNNDGTISNAELNGTVGVTVALPAEAVAGDTLNVTGQTPIVLSQTQIDAGSIDFEYAAPADGETIEVVATITDQAGNESAEGSDSAVIGDTTATGAPTVTITEDANNDGTISNTELNGTVGVTVSLPSGAVAGDTLNVTGQTPIVLSQTQIDAGSIDFEYAAPADGETIEVVATVTDQAGNESAEGSDSAVIGDTTATVAPTVTITEDTNNDGTISNSELNGTVGVTVSLPSGAVVGDTLNVTGQTPIVLSQTQIDAGSIDFEYAAPADGETIEVVATVTDQAGNESAEGSDSAVIGDTTATGAPTVTITEDTNNDGTISNSELNGTVGVTVTLPAEAVAGDTLNVTGQTPIVLSQTQIDAGSIDFEYAAPADGETIEVVATVTDQAGNESAEGSDSAVIGDTTATGAPTVTITEDTNNDGTISNSELNGTVGVTVTLPAEAVAGDTLNVTGQTPIVLSQTQIDAGSIDFEYAAPADGETIEVVATVTDQAGNESAEGSDSATVQLVSGSAPTANADTDAVVETVALGWSTATSWKAAVREGIVSVESGIEGVSATAYFSGASLGVQTEGDTYGESGNEGQLQHRSSNYADSSEAGTSEAIVIKLDGLTTEASFRYTNLYPQDNSQNYVETGKWIALRDGKVVAEDTFSSNKHYGSETINTNGILFDEVRFEAVDYSNRLLNDGSDSSDYYLQSFEADVYKGDLITGENDVLTIASDTLLANDTDPDGDNLAIVSVAATSSSGATKGNVSFDPATGKVSYDPADAFDDLDAGETATDTFTYTITDGNGNEHSAEVTVTIVGQTGVEPQVRASLFNELLEQPNELDDLLPGGDGNQVGNSGDGSPQGEIKAPEEIKVDLDL